MACAVGDRPIRAGRNYLRTAGWAGVDDKRGGIGFKLPLGVRTFTCTAPGMAMSAAETWNVNCDALTNDVGPSPNPGLPGLLQTTSAPELKLLPFTVRVNAGPSAVALVGDMEETTGGEAAGGGLDDDTPLPPQPGNPTRRPSTMKQSRHRELICPSFCSSRKQDCLPQGHSIFSSARALKTITPVCTTGLMCLRQPEKKERHSKHPRPWV